MDNIIFNSLDDTDLFFDRLKVIGSGREGNCYRKGNWAWKKYKELYSNLYSNDIAIERLLRFRNLIIDNIYFIRALICCDNRVVGSISEYVSGVSCAKMQLHRCKLDNLINALNILRKNILVLSELGICIDEYFLGNVLYNGVNFKLIDTGGYYYYSDMPLVDSVDTLFIYRKNMKIVSELFRNITDKKYVDDHFIYGFLQDIDSVYKDYLEDIDLMVNPDETIIGIRRVIEEYVGYEIDTFSECRKLLLRKRSNAR